MSDFFCGGGGGEGVCKNVCQILETINFFKWRNCWENLVSKKEFYVKAKRSHLNLDKSGIGNETPDRRSHVGIVRILL